MKWSLRWLPSFPDILRAPLSFFHVVSGFCQFWIFLNSSHFWCSALWVLVWSSLLFLRMFSEWFHFHLLQAPGLTGLVWLVMFLLDLYQLQKSLDFDNLSLHYQVLFAAMNIWSSIFQSAARGSSAASPDGQFQPLRFQILPEIKKPLVGRWSAFLKKLSLCRE